jgi:hypothetical protein
MERKTANDYNRPRKYFIYRNRPNILINDQLLGGVIFLSKLLRGAKEVLYLLAGL